MSDNGYSNGRGEVGNVTVKRGLAQMLKGGVIMDVVTPEHAVIAEEAGAVAVMALERVPADIRADGGVARMSDPGLIKEIMASVSIPVMAKVRIGHFVEAQILEAIGVDYIDESEVLTPADEAHHIYKHEFKVPFVCGCRNLGEALRRIGEGAAMIRTKGEAGTGDVVEAVRHARSVLGEIRRLQNMPDEELMTFAKEIGAPFDLVQGDQGTRPPAGGQLRRRRHCHPGRRRPDDAVGRGRRVRRLRHLQERRPGSAGQGHCRSHDPFPQCRNPGPGQRKSGRADGRHQRQLACRRANSWLSAAGKCKNSTQRCKGRKVKMALRLGVSASISFE